MKSLNKLILYTTVFCFPLFFLPITQEFFVTNKLYLLSFSCLLMLILSTIRFAITKKIVWPKKVLNKPVFLFIMAVALSVVVSSPNKISALLNPNFGLVEVITLFILYIYISRLNDQESRRLFNLFGLSVLISAFISVIFFFIPVKLLELPLLFQFIKNPGFTPFGNLIDLGIILTFITAFLFVDVLNSRREKNFNHLVWIKLSVAVVCLLVVSYRLFLIFGPVNATVSQVNLPPFRMSWYAAVETLKNPLTAVFGYGVDNFSTVFTLVKDILYNQSSLWQVNAFSFSRSAILQILSEAGLFGLISFVLILITVFKQLRLNKDRQSQAILAGLGFLTLALFIFPISLNLLFVIFMVTGLTGKTKLKESKLNPALSAFLIAPLIIILILCLGYFLGRSYLADYAFRKSLNAGLNSKYKEVYDNQQSAVLLNPFIEAYHIGFSQTNLMIANNILNNATQNASSGSARLNDQDRQTVDKALRLTVSEAKAAINLNPQRATNWENLALIYRSFINSIKDADIWTISSYQRAIILDPNNPIYRINLGDIFYMLKNYDQAQELFQQTVFLKPDWPNGYFGLAWTYYQKGNYKSAVTETQAIISHLDPKKNKSEYDRAIKDLEEFKKKM